MLKIYASSEEKLEIPERSRVVIAFGAPKVILPWVS